MKATRPGTANRTSTASAMNQKGAPHRAAGRVDKVDLQGRKKPLGKTQGLSGSGKRFGKQRRPIFTGEEEP
ncbi:hypothetical protein GCM10010421_23560 [Streptomyces glaucus]|uniref:Secreted protein n=1 Tax=Streptomyces glaucus TaxID=284029 RepID=A0ABP5WTV5_9ACTN